MRSKIGCKPAGEIGYLLLEVLLALAILSIVVVMIFQIILIKLHLQLPTNPKLEVFKPVQPIMNH